MRLHNSTESLLWRNTLSCFVDYLPGSAHWIDLSSSLSDVTERTFCCCDLRKKRSKQVVLEGGKYDCVCSSVYHHFQWAVLTIPRVLSNTTMSRNAHDSISENLLLIAWWHRAVSCIQKCGENHINYGITSIHRSLNYMLSSCGKSFYILFSFWES